MDPQEVRSYRRIFHAHNPVSGYLSAEAARIILYRRLYRRRTSGGIWELADIDKDGRLDLDEFYIAMRLTFDLLNNTGDIPRALPPHLVPPAKAHLLLSGSRVSLQMRILLLRLGSSPHALRRHHHRETTRRVSIGI